MKKYARIITLLLAVSLYTQLLACGDTVDDGSESVTTETTTPETEKPYLDNLGEYNFDGADFTMLVRETRVNDIAPDEATGDVVSDAIYNRNAKISERFNVNIVIETLPDDSNMWNSTLDGEVMAGSDAYDVVMPDYWWGCETRGLFLDLHDYDEILEFDQPWWTAGWNDNAEIYGQLYSAVGSMSLDLIQNQNVMYFNKELVDSLNLDNIYDIIKSGDWTLDRFNEFLAVGSSDLNGDGELTLEDDQLGYACALQAGRAMLAAAGMQVATKTDDGSWEYNFMNERFVDRYDAIYNLLHNTEGVVYNTTVSLENVFKSGHLLFLGASIGSTDLLRDMEIDFGIIPMPKMDDSQEDYVTYNFGTYYMAILLTAANPEMSAVMLEALNAESYKSVVNVYYDTALKNKYSRDEESREMIDLINSKCFFDFTFVNETSTDHIVMWFFQQLEAKQQNITSLYEGRRAGFEQKLADLLETYQKNALEG